MSSLVCKDLSVQSKLPEPTVAKVLKSLGKHNIVLSHRGVRGGYSLNKPAAEINMAAVVTALDGPIALTACVEESAECCSYGENCKIKGHWNPVNLAMHKVLEDVSLDQMIGHS